jgi:putative tryptophan/tyrosine transport system substrate-binding protein
MIDRRAFAVGGAITLATSIAVGAQQPTNVPKLGYLSALSRSDPTYVALRGELLQGLSEHGYVEGRTIAVQWRFANGIQSDLPKLAAELMITA